MLVFKDNIYEKRDIPPLSSNPAKDLQGWLDPYILIRNSIQDDLGFFELMERSQNRIPKEDLAAFFPHSHRFSDGAILKTLLGILQEGLEDRKTWYRMNTYHFCLLYDSFFRHVYNYNHDSREEMIKSYPGLKGQPLQFNLAIRDHFFNTVFLLDEDKYGDLSAADKRRLGFTCPCQFGVIHGLTPNGAEMRLRVEHSFPYTIYV